MDLGSSHTVALLRQPGGRVRPLLFDGHPLLPSAVYRDTTGRLHVGRDAIRLGHAEPARLVPSPKRHVDAGSVLLAGAEVPVPDLLAALLAAVAREAVATVGHLPPAVLTCPASWGPPRRAVLREALARAGWPADTALVEEPVAAARYFTEVLHRPVPPGQALAVVDFGGGTLDVAVVRPAPDGHFEVTASGGLGDLGGLDLDAALVGQLGTGLRRDEPAAWAALEQPSSLAEGRARRRFQEDVREAKEMLSRTQVAPVSVPGVERAVELTREEFELVAAPLVRRGVAEARAVIEAAGVAPGELAGLFLVGGSSRVPLVARLLHSELGVAPTVLEQPELAVAEGALLEWPPSEEPRTVAIPAPDLSPQATPEPDYAEPVDPWATGEAAALAAAHGGIEAPPLAAAHGGIAAPPLPAPAGVGTPHEQPARRAYRRKGLVAVAAVVMLAAATGLTVRFWPGDRALGYRPLGDPVRIAAPVEVSSFSAAGLRDGRAYFAGGDSDGRLGVVAADVESGKELWRSQAAGVADRWESFFTVPHAVVAVTGTDLETSDRRMVFLSPGDGSELWQRRVAPDDEVVFAGDIAVLVDRAENRLVGLAVRDHGKAAWELKSPQSRYGGSTTAVVPATTRKDVAGPASAGGTAFAAAGGDDRVVQIGADRSARVIDTSTGEVVAGPRQSVADPDDALLAHDGRLVVAESGSGSRVAAYDLAELGEPRILYTPPDPNTRLEKLTPCGADRVCGVQKTGYDAATARVVALDTADGGVLWTRQVAGAESLLPVGDAVLVSSTSPAQVTLLDADGKVTWTRAGAAGRLDAGNLLLFSKDLSSSADDPALSGLHVGDEVEPLGALTDVRSGTCAWDTAHLACVAAEDFVIQRFAS
nr:Hsp70 family protein [Actinoplanes lichenis]